MFCAGACPPNFKKAMEAEHCTLGGCDEPFTTLNHTEIQSTPRKEWQIVMGVTPCPQEHMRFNRRIPVIKDLLALPLAAQARLTDAEVTAIVLYTGPMVSSPRPTLSFLGSYLCTVTPNLCCAARPR